MYKLIDEGSDEPRVSVVINFRLASASLYLRSSRLYSLRWAAADPTISRVIVSKENMTPSAQYCKWRSRSAVSEIEALEGGRSEGNDAGMRNSTRCAPRR